MMVFARILDPMARRVPVNACLRHYLSFSVKPLYRSTAERGPETNTTARRPARQSSTSNIKEVRRRDQRLKKVDAHE
jgi:hypothetical protein